MFIVTAVRTLDGKQLRVLVPVADTASVGSKIP